MRNTVFKYFEQYDYLMIYKNVYMKKILQACASKKKHNAPL